MDTMYTLVLVVVVVWRGRGCEVVGGGCDAYLLPKEPEAQRGCCGREGGAFCFFIQQNNNNNINKISANPFFKFLVAAKSKSQTEMR